MSVDAGHNLANALQADNVTIMYITLMIIVMSCSGNITTGLQIYIIDLECIGRTTK